MRRLAVGFVLGAVLASGVAAAGNRPPGPERRQNLRYRIEHVERVQAGLCAYLIAKFPEDRAVVFTCADERP